MEAMEEQELGNEVHSRGQGAAQGLLHAPPPPGWPSTTRLSFLTVPTGLSTTDGCKDATTI